MKNDMDVLVLHHRQYEQRNSLDIPTKQSESSVLLHHTPSVVRQVSATILPAELATPVVILVQRLHRQNLKAGFGKKRDVKIKSFQTFLVEFFKNICTETQGWKLLYSKYETLPKTSQITTRCLATYITVVVA